MRESGYYIVKVNGVWEIADYSCVLNQWMRVGSEKIYYDEDFEKIGNKKISIHTYI